MGSTRNEARTADGLSRLATSRDHDVVSILIPRRPAAEARLTLRNLVRRAVAQAHGRADEAAVAPAAAHMLAYVEDPDHWRLPEMDLALYADGDSLAVLPGPSGGEPIVALARRFHVTHLVGAAAPLRYAVVALSKGTSHLYCGVGDQLSEVRTSGLPAAMEDVLRFDDREPQLQSHGSSRRGGGAVVAAFHGQGGRADQLEDLSRYFRFVAAEVEAVLGGEPLVLAATHEMAAAFRNVTNYDAVVGQIVGGSPEHASVHELAAHAAGIIAELERARRREIIERIGVPGELRTIHDVGEVLTAACDGRVELLAVAEDGHVWGGYDVADRRVTHLDSEPGGVDLVNEAACETWLHGGEVVQASASDIPGSWPVAARLRF